MIRLKKILKNSWPIAVILSIVGLIALFNYEAGNFLTGGDNLHTELGRGLNLKRAFFSVWQEYQGLGLLGGMGHATDIIRQLFLLPFSLFLPENAIRWLYTFLTLLIGTVGAFYLSRRVLYKYRVNDLFKINFLSLSGSLFYLLNLSTVQSYFTPFEAFTSHFAFLPWLLLATIKYFERSNHKNLLILAIVVFISIPMFYVPTLFLVYIGASLVISAFYFEKTKVYFKRFLTFLTTVFLINSFWLLPFLFFTMTSSKINLLAKINQMATEGIYLQNKEFGGILDVVLLKGFWLNYIEPDTNGRFVYMFFQWREHINNPIVTTVGYLLFALVLVGVIYAIKQRKKTGLAMVGLFGASILMLTTATPPFSWINDLIRESLPLFNQVFRFPFTKFSILASLSFAMLFPLGILGLISLTKKNTRNIFFAFSLIPIVLMGVFVLPLFKGQLFYEREKIEIPKEYSQTIEFFKDQEKESRIANFPQYTFWGWSFYDWGYSGSGFTWYGIEQPILDRNFDMWLSANENYFWEANHALYSKNPKLLETVLNKYDVSWILIDRNIISLSPKSLFTEETEQLISEIPSIKKEKDFGKITIYKVDRKNNKDGFISSIHTLSSTNSYKWSNYDQAYSENGDYFSKQNEIENSSYYPFRSIFTGKNQTDIDFEYKETEKYIDFYKEIPAQNQKIDLYIPSLITQNSMLPVNIVAQRKGSTVEIGFQLKSPAVYLNNGKTLFKIWNSEIERSLFDQLNSNLPITININGVSSFKIEHLKDNEKKIIGSTSLTIDEDNFVFISKDYEELDGVQVSGEMIKEWFFQNEASVSLPRIIKNSTLVIRVPKLNDGYSNIKIDPVKKIKDKEVSVINCDNFRKDYFAYFIKDSEQKKLIELSSKNASPCLSFYLPTLEHDQGYLLSAKNKNLKGRGLHFWVLNEDQKTPLIDTYFESNKEQTTSSIILPPMEKFGKAYSIHFDNISIGKDETGNLIGDISINPIPFYFLSNIRLKTRDKPMEFTEGKITNKHPNQSLYLIETSSRAITLSQSYSPFWKAYEVKNDNLLSQIFPFFGREIKKHVMVNNWKNGWIIDEGDQKAKNKKIAIIYLPQYLQYFGFLLLFGSFAYMVYAVKKDRHGIDF